MFWNNFYKLCNEKGLKPTQVVKILGLSAGSPTSWKNGRIPSKKTLSILAKYFEIEIEDFFKNQENSIETTPEETSLLIAYRKADESIKKSVRKLLDIEEPTNRAADSDPKTELQTEITKAFTKTTT